MKEKIVKLFDKILINFLVIHSLVFIIILAGISAYLYIQHESKLWSTINRTFLDHKTHISEAVYINEMVDNEDFTELESVRAFEDLINESTGSNIQVSIDTCATGSESVHFLKLSIGSKILGHCLKIASNKTIITSEIKLVTQIWFTLFVATLLIWFGIRKKLWEKIALPLLTELEKSSKQEATIKLSRQVAHDIRSPLASLRTIMKCVVDLKEEERTIVTCSINRIHDITNNLLAKVNVKSNQSINELRPVSAIDSLERLVYEKRSQQSKVKIDYQIDGSNIDQFLDIPTEVFNRVLSNIIGNAIDATHESGWVKIKSRSNDQNVTISIEDNGIGIAREHLDKIFNPSYTHGKENGNGLGLSYVQEMSSKFGFNVSLESRPNNGTTFYLKFKRLRPPSWFTSEIVITDNCDIVVVDDDAPIHGTWKKTLRPYLAKLRKSRLFHVYGPKEFRSFMNDRDINRDIIILIDQNFIGHETLGIDLIQEFALENVAYLVTSGADEYTLQKKCENKKIKLISKMLGEYIKIKVQSNQREFDAVYVEDEVYLLKLWELTAKKAGKNILTVSSYDELHPYLSDLDQSTPIYLDHELKTGPTGYDISKKLFKKGFDHLFLTSYHNRDLFPDRSHLLGITDKTPPWQ